MFKRTTSVNKILAMKKRKKVIPGGTSAGKTIAILIILISVAAKYKNKEISVVSESVPHLRRGALKDFLKIMKETGRYIDKNYNRTRLTYEFESGSYIEFFGADQEDKLRGARRHILYINEANNVTFEAYNQLAIRTSEDIYIDFNPSGEFWVHTDLIGDEDVEEVVLTYKDNEGLPETIVKDIESKKEKAKTSTYWQNWWNVYGLGQVGKLEGVIFENWSIIDKIPKEAKLIGYGMDFGYTNDPTTLMACYKYNDELIWDELIHERGMTNIDIAKRMQRLDIKSNSYIYADSSEPKSIAEINSFGFKIRGAEKGKDSIMFGISVLQDYKMHLTARSQNSIKELRKYCYDKSKTGAKLNRPIDDYNHSADAMRYLAMSKLSTKKNSMRIKKSSTFNNY